LTALNILLNDEEALHDIQVSPAADPQTHETGRRLPGTRNEVA
jgi:hypothetical protein